MDMTYWCESCARKANCYTIRSRPKCFTPITNTAHGTPESYLAKSLRYSRDSHEIAKDEPNCSEKPNNCEPKICDTCRYYNSNIPCGSTPSACKEADKFAEEFVDGLKKLKLKVEPQTEYDKGLQLFADILFDKEKSEQFLKECKAMGIEPQTERNE